MHYSAHFIVISNLIIFEVLYNFRLTSIYINVHSNARLKILFSHMVTQGLKMSRRLKCTFWSRVVRRPSVVNFSHFRLLFWNRWTEFNGTWQEARSQRPLPSLYFSGWLEKQDGCPGLWFAETFSTSLLKPRNEIQRNLTGSKISTPSTKFVFFGLISKQKCLPWSIPQKGGTLYSGARYVAIWASWFWWDLVRVDQILKKKKCVYGGTSLSTGSKDVM